MVIDDFYLLRTQGGKCLSKQCLFKVLIVFGIGSAIAAYFIYGKVAAPEPWGSGDLEAERESFVTNLLTRGPAPQRYEKAKVPPDAREVTYSSDGLQLKAWLSRNRTAGDRPGLVFVHGGFAFSSADWEQTKPFREAGYIVLAPMLRGENGGPGDFEAFYGEVNDVVAAGNYLASLQGVESKKVFVCGHSTGGTLTMLSSMVTSPFCAAASIGGSPDQEMFFKSLPQVVPFELNQLAEIAMRSPIRFPNSLRCPLFIMVGTTDYFFHFRSMQLADAAVEYGHECEYITVEGDHHTSVPLAIQTAIDIFSEF